MFINYVLKFNFQDCLNILSEQDPLGCYSIKIDFLKLFETYPDVGDSVLCNPVVTLRTCDCDLVQAQRIILEDDNYKADVIKLPFFVLKKNVHARFFGLPVCPELHRSVFPKNVDLGCFLKVTGTVVRVTQAKMLEYCRKYVCIKCKYENFVEADFEHRFVLKAPTKCGNTESRCKCTTFSQVNLVSQQHCKDYQEIKIQEQVNKLSIGTIPGSMWVIMDDDLVDSCKPGDDVNICGTVRRRWRPTAQNKRSEVELVLHANYVEVCNSQKSQILATAPDVKDCFDEYWNKFDNCPMKGRDQILATVCPQVYGLHLVKLALLLTIITGHNHIVENEKRNTSEENHRTNVRGQCHLLLVGDPGTGKSQLLRAAVELTPRSVFTSGAGSTRAGLTCSALREDGEWQLEAGALVLSDGGVCCIDEISQLREHDRTSIHEAMEQQTISIAKAGIVCKLNTRCAVVAACNPKGHYQTDQPLSVNVSLGTPLLSRFDLIFILLDTKNKQWDKLVTSYILFGKSEECTKQWNIEKLQMYIGLIGPRRTEMTKSANIILQTYYMMQRKSQYRDSSRTTVRMLDSLLRLSQAHCCLMYRTKILPMDAIIAVTLVDLSMQDCTLKDTTDALHSTVPQYPDYDYLLTAKKLLTRLSLYEIWREELLYYAKILNVDHKTLDSEINDQSVNLFTRFDNVSYDNIPLSSSLVTSSYFNNKRANIDNNTNGANLDRNKEPDNIECNVKENHAALHKIKKPIVTNIKRNGKRKRKELILDTDKISTKINKINRKYISKKSNSKSSDESGGDYDTDLLKAVPSVNDVFRELNVDLESDNSNYSYNNYEEDSESNSTKLNNCDGDNRNQKVNHIETLTEVRKSNKKTSVIPNFHTDNNQNGVETKPKEQMNNAKDKLQQFKFVAKSEIDKSGDENIYNENIIVKKERDVNEGLKRKDGTVSKSNSSISVNSISNSQVSIFESSDCDIDFDII